MEEPTAKEKGLDTCSVPEAQSYDSSVPGEAFDQDLFTGGRPRKVWTRSQKRESKKAHSDHGPSGTQEYQKLEFCPESTKQQCTLRLRVHICFVLLCSWLSQYIMRVPLKINVFWCRNW